MSANDSTMENALLVIAKDLLQASDDLAATDPSASAKLAQEAYEIGRDLGIVRNHLDGKEDLALASAMRPAAKNNHAEKQHYQPAKMNGAPRRYEGARRAVREDSDDHLSRILDRQKELLPARGDVAPARAPSPHAGQSLTFESLPKRTGWLSWMRPREWRHAG